MSFARAPESLDVSYRCRVLEAEVEVQVSFEGTAHDVATSRHVADVSAAWYGDNNPLCGIGAGDITIVALSMLRAGFRAR